MPISSPGVGSGLDVNSIITQLMAIERQPITALQKQGTKIQTQLSEFGKLKSAIAAVRDTSLKLTSNDTWGTTIGSSSDSRSVGITTATGATAGTFAVTVQSLASAQSLASTPFASSTTAPGAGTLHIELGTWGVGQTTFAPKAGSPAVDITIDATDTLAQVRDKINGANAGVTALILNDANGARLLMRSNASGVDGGFRTSVVDADGVNTDATGLSALAFDPSASVTSMTQTLAAANANATVNGLAVTSASNTLSNLVDGITLKLGALTTAPVQLDVTQDNVALKKSMQDFADAYNALAKLLATEIKYDAATKTAGPLQGDSSVTGLQQQFRRVAGNSSTASTTFAHLSDAGFELQRDGTLSVNATKLDNALTNLPELKKLFATNNIADSTQNGFARQFRVLGDALLGVDGVVTTRSDGLHTKFDRNQTQQDQLTQRLALTEKRLRAQYTALDATMAKLNGLSNYVTQQITATNNSNNGR